MTHYSRTALLHMGNVYSVASSPIETAHPSMCMTPAPTIDSHFDALRARNIDKRQGKGDRAKKRCSGKLSICCAGVARISVVPWQQTPASSSAHRVRRKREKRVHRSRDTARGRLHMHTIHYKYTIHWHLSTNLQFKMIDMPTATHQ